jgi:hypothetical protein
VDRRAAARGKSAVRTDDCLTGSDSSVAPLALAVRQAINLLAHDGLVSPRRGRGTFVNDVISIYRLGEVTYRGDYVHLELDLKFVQVLRTGGP